MSKKAAKDRQNAVKGSVTIISRPKKKPIPGAK